MGESELGAQCGIIYWRERKREKNLRLEIVMFRMGESLPSYSINRSFPVSEHIWDIYPSYMRGCLLISDVYVLTRFQY